MLKADLKQLSTIKLNLKDFGFTEWTSEIDLVYDDFYPDFQPQD